MCSLLLSHVTYYFFTGFARCLRSSWDTGVSRSRNRRAARSGRLPPHFNPAVCSCTCDMQHVHVGIDRDQTSHKGRAKVDRGQACHTSSSEQHVSFQEVQLQIIDRGTHTLSWSMPRASNDLASGNWLQSSSFATAAGATGASATAGGASAGTSAELATWPGEAAADAVAADAPLLLDTGCGASCRFS